MPVPGEESPLPATDIAQIHRVEEWRRLVKASDDERAGSSNTESPALLTAELENAQGQAPAVPLGERADATAGGETSDPGADGSSGAVAEQRVVVSMSKADYDTLVAAVERLGSSLRESERRVAVKNLQRVVNHGQVCGADRKSTRLNSSHWE